VLDRMEDGSSAYIVPTALRLRGALNAALLEKCFGEVTRRHDVLRATIGIDPDTGLPYQAVSEWKPFKLEVLDLCDEPEELRLRRARSIANDEARHRFDLSTGPLLRASLLRLAEQDHVLLLMIHHIVSDMWSTQILTREITALYSAFACGSKSPLPDLPIQYVDFANWQRNRLSGDLLERQLSYWRGHLCGRLPLLDLPTKGQRPPRHTTNGAEKEWSLSRDTVESLRRLSRARGATLFMTLLAAFKVLLFRYTNQEDLIVGSAIAGRTRREVEGLSGLFINTLVLRTGLSGDPTFEELLRRVKEVGLGAYANQDVPFEKLVDELAPDRDLSRTPMFQVMFSLQNVPENESTSLGLSIAPFPLEVKTAKFDLTLTTLEDERGLNGVWEYNTDLFGDEFIERM